MKNFKSIKKTIKDIPISSVLEMWDENALREICPFHDDKSGGSFKYKDEADGGGIFKCFCCDTYGDKVDFVMKYDNVDFKEAIYRIALRFEKITEEEYKAVSSFNPAEFQKKEVKIKKIKRVQEVEKREPKFVDRFYRFLRDYWGLDEHHKKYLLDRGVSEDELDRYFTMKKADDQFFYAVYNELGLFSKELIGIPGIYVDEKGCTQLKEMEGIGIPMTNADGYITGIQVRRDNVEDKRKRYIFLSSTGLEKGCSVGTVADVERIYCDKGSFFITEGHFKALELKKHFGVSAISVQGVNNTACLDAEIKTLQEQMEIRRFIIAFDADMVYNPQVLKAAKKLKAKLENFNIPTGFMVWDVIYGKGCDDVINAGFANQFKFVRDLELEE